jgi:hypothetical protein
LGIEAKTGEERISVEINIVARVFIVSFISLSL